MKNWFRFITSLKNWYQFYSDVKAWYKCLHILLYIEELESKAKPLQMGGFRECEEYVRIVHFFFFLFFIMKFLPTYIYTNTYMRQGLGLGKAYHCPLPSVLQFTFIKKVNSTMHNNICHIHFIYTIKSTC